MSEKETIKELIHKIKVNEKSRRKMQQSLMKEIERLKEDNEYLNKVNIELSIEKNRLTNIINELDIEANKNIQVCNNRGFNLISNIDEVKTLDDFTFNEYIGYLVSLEISDKLQELKGDSSND